MRTYLYIFICIIAAMAMTSGCKPKKGNMEEFGKADGLKVYLYTLTNRQGTAVRITNYGATITQLFTSDRNGRPGDIVLGYDGLSQYMTNSPYFGCIAGRYANRIAKGKFTLDGKEYSLAVNNGNNHLHGGIKGFDKVVWNAKEYSDSTGASLMLNYFSRDGEEGYPGNLHVYVTYTLNNENELIITIEAITDKPTPVNLCNHTYFNLNEGKNNILGHHLVLAADRYTEVDSELIPTGNLPSVTNSPMDFLTSHLIGERIGQVPGGYDHNFVLDKEPGVMDTAAILSDSSSGRVVTILTTQPGVQFYSGNFLDGTITGKNGIVYGKHWGLCLETQHFPDSPNQPSFPETILRPGERYKEVTVFRFSTMR